MTTSIERVSLPLTSPLLIAALLFSTAACSNPSAVSPSNNKSTATESKEVSISDSNAQTATKSTTQTKTSKPAFTTKAIATFDEPWAMTALPSIDGKAPKLLVTQKNRRVIHCRHGDG
nr:hypothetical protein [Psychrobacter sp. KH172YL61]